MRELVKLAGIAWVGTLSFIFAYLVSTLLDNFTPKLDKTKPKWRTFAEVSVQFAIVAMIVYGARIVLKKIPFPLDGVSGYTHSQLSELRSLPLLVFIFMFFQRRTQDKMRHLFLGPDRSV
jgi:hypothetical protein